MEKIRYTWMFVCPTGCGNYVCFHNKSDTPKKGRICMGCGEDMGNWTQHKAREVSVPGGCRKRPESRFFCATTGKHLATYIQPDRMVGDFY